MSFATLQYISVINREKLNMTVLSKIDRYFLILYNYKPTGSQSYSINLENPTAYITDQNKIGYWLKLLKTYDSVPINSIDTNSNINTALTRILTLRGYRNNGSNLIIFKNMYKDYRNFLVTVSRNQQVWNDFPSDAYWGSDRALKFGRVVMDVLNINIDEVFGHLLHPTGGIIGAGINELIQSYNDTSLSMHAIVHDAGGFLYIVFNRGYGYPYLISYIPFFERSIRMNGFSGQVEGIAKWTYLIQYGFQKSNPLIRDLSLNLDFRTLKTQLKLLTDSIYSEYRVLSSFTSYTTFSIQNQLNCFIGTQKIQNEENYNLYITFDCIATLKNENTNATFNELVSGDATDTYINNDYYYIYKNIKTIFLKNLVELLIKNSITESQVVCNIKNIFIGGHRLGGVVASLASFDVCYYLPQLYITNLNNTQTSFSKIHLCLFDTPRIGDTEYGIQIYQNINNLWRFNHVNDVFNGYGNLNTYVHPPNKFVNINVNNTYTEGSGDTKRVSYTLNQYINAFKIRNPSSINVYRNFFTVVV
jgi:hypothetical protein